MAEDQYFLKRGDAVKGPFSLQKLQSLLAAKKLKANDLVGASDDGPWERLAAVHKTIRAGQPLELGTETAAKTEGTVSPPQQPQNPNLIECADCGKAISKRAASCPHCGAPVEDSTAETASGDDEYGYEDDEYGYEDDEYGYEDDEYEYGDDLSTPDDTYRPAAQRKPKKKTKALKKDTTKQDAPKRRQWPLWPMYIISIWLVVGGVFGLLDNSGALDSAEYLEAKSRADAAQQRYESEYASNQRRAHELTQSNGGLVGALEDVTNELQIQSHMTELQNRHNERDSYEEDRQGYRDKMMLRSTLALLVGLMGLYMLIRKSIQRRTMQE